MEIKKGIAVSPGIVIAKSLVIDSEDYRIPRRSIDSSQRPAEVQRIEYLCQGISIPDGTHDIVLSYSPSRFFFYIQCAGYLILFVTLLSNPWKKNEDA